MMDPTSRDEDVADVRVRQKLLLYLTRERSTHLCVFVSAAGLAASALAEPSSVSRVRISLRRTEDVLKTLSTTLRLQVAAKEPLCHD